MQLPSLAVLNVLLLTIVFCNPSNAQVLRTENQVPQVSVSNLKLNPWQEMPGSEKPWKGYAMEYLGFQIGYLGGGAVTGGLFAVGFIAAWGGSREIAIPFLIGSGMAALATPFLSAYLMNRFGQKYRPEGKYGVAVAASFIGMGVTGGISALTQLVISNRYNYENDYPAGLRFAARMNNVALFLLPGVISVFIYNKFPKAVTTDGNSAFFNYNEGKLRVGNPEVSISPNPFIPGQIFTQFKLLSVSF